MEAAYHACIRLRAAVRVLHLVADSKMDPDRGSGYDELYAIVRKAAAWETMIGPGMTFGADVRMQSCTGWNHSGMAQNCIQAAVNDALRDSGCGRHGLYRCATCRPSFACPLVAPACALRAINEHASTCAHRV